MRYAILGTGSSGNSYLIQTAQGLFMVDAGLSFAQLKERATHLGADLSAIKAIFITHEHSDHVCGLRIAMKRLQVPVFLSPGTRRQVEGGQRHFHEPEYVESRALLANLAQPISHGARAQVADLDVKAIDIPHDCAEPIAFRFSSGGQDLIIVSDIGHISEPIRQWLNTADHLLVESNHCTTLLANSPLYSEHLKRRIASANGHLSNGALSDWLENDFTDRARHITLIHLSEKTNTPSTAQSAVQASLHKAGSTATLAIGAPHNPSGWVDMQLS